MEACFSNHQVSFDLTVMYGNTVAYIFDTNAFNNLVDDKTPISLSNIEIYLSHVQLKEIRATKNSERRDSLLKIAIDVSQKGRMPTETMTFPLVFKEQNFSNNDQLISIISDLNGKVSSLGNKKKKQKEKGHPNDAQIAEIAINNAMTLVTNDGELTAVIKNYGCKVITYEQFKIKNT